MRESSLTWLFGWWSITGVFLTPAALWSNFWLGEKPNALNSQLLISQGLYFLEDGQKDLANSCFQQARPFAIGDEADFLTKAPKLFGLENLRFLKDNWKLASDKQFIKQLIPIAIVALFVGFMLVPKVSKSIAPNLATVTPKTEIK